MRGPHESTKTLKGPSLRVGRFWYGGSWRVETPHRTGRAGRISAVRSAPIAGNDEVRIPRAAFPSTATATPMQYGLRLVGGSDKTMNGGNEFARAHRFHE